MRRSFWFVAVSLVLAAPLAIAADRPTAGKSAPTKKGARPDSGPGAPAKPADRPTPTTTEVKAAIAQLNPTENSKVRGTVRFTAVAGDKVQIVAEVEGLKPGEKHGFHVHEFGDCSKPDGSSAGGHYNPEGHQHGLTDKTERHAGDFGNLTADAQGKARLELTVDNLTLTGKNAVLGRGVIVHVQADDGGQPTGNAGGRAACGVVGVAKP